LSYAGTTPSNSYTTSAPLGGLGFFANPYGVAVNGNDNLFVSDVGYSAVRETQLYNSLMLTSGAMTNRIDRLEAASLVERLHDPADRRGVLVSLTKDGLKLIDKAVTKHMEVEEAMLASLSSKDREKFAELLRTLSQDLEPSPSASRKAILQ
jgi:DNA-binding MarR family transcriptional regulator